ncbi:hypothetical protein [Clostridium botulinum]|uniref:hypothetical protein n=1 Tax=Clostridium botulinum TaxID=1491 RepID=UPI000A84AE74|nr:hypothetical protein [Clostridium botulinum]
MKRYEKFNNTFKTKESAEEQSLKMIIAHIQDNYNIDISWWEERYKAQVKWLNEKVY